MGQRVFQLKSGRDFNDEQLRCIERQHRHVYALVKDFNPARRRGADRDRLLFILKEIIHWAQGHFATEERILFEVASSGYSLQKAAHRVIIDELTLFHDFVMSSKSVTRDQCIHAMDSLLVHHIKDDPTYFASQRGTDCRRSSAH
jgi:hemerythrin-like metal-binding protein